MSFHQIRLHPAPFIHNYGLPFDRLEVADVTGQGIKGSKHDIWLHHLQADPTPHIGVCLALHTPQVLCRALAHNCLAWEGPAVFRQPDSCSGQRPGCAGRHDNRCMMCLRLTRTTV